MRDFDLPIAAAGGCLTRACRRGIVIDMSDTPPDRLSADPKSPHHNAGALERGVGIRFNARERDDVEEYSISEGWVRVPAGKAVDRHGRPMTIKLKGVVEAYFRS